MNTQIDTPDLDGLLEKVHDEKTFIAFVEALANDFAREQELEAANPSGPYGPGSSAGRTGQ